MNDLRLVVISTVIVSIAATIIGIVLSKYNLFK